MRFEVITGVKISMLVFETLKMEALCLSEKLVSTRKYTQRC
jgi:hypothetical protein